MPKVSKKLEKLARAFAYKGYTENGMLQAKGSEFIHNFVDERWHMFLDEAEAFNRCLLVIDDSDLSGFYFEN